MPIKQRSVSWLLTATLAAVIAIAGAVRAQLPVPTETHQGDLESVFEYDGAMPTGVTVSQTGRIFTNFPRWGDRVEFTAAEIRAGALVPVPDLATNQPDPNRAAETLFSVQSVVVDPQDRLWLLDTGAIEFGPVVPGAAKLVGIDLETNQVFQTVVLPPEVALETTYLNDVRFDLRRGQAGMAFITDSSLSGENGIIVVDLATGESWRRLRDHASVRPEPEFQAIVEGQQALVVTGEDGQTQSLQVGADGIALGADGEYLYYCVLSGRHLYRVSVDALTDRRLTDAQVAATVEDLGEKGGASDGLAADSRDRIYLTDYEHNAIRRRVPDGTLETLVHDPRVLWPDTLALATDGYLYFTANQLHRQATFAGNDARQQPYSLFRVRVDADPVLLR